MTGISGAALEVSTLKQASGTLLYRHTQKGWEVLLVHPSGNYNRKARWSIPKGGLESDEDLETAARRETREETGLHAGKLCSLGFIEYTRTRKRVHCFGGPAPNDIEPHCASREVDQAEFIALKEAKELIHPDQAPFIDRLEKLLKKK